MTSARLAGVDVDALLDESHAAAKSPPPPPPPEPDAAAEPDARGAPREDGAPPEQAGDSRGERERDAGRSEERRAREERERGTSRGPDERGSRSRGRDERGRRDSHREREYSRHHDRDRDRDRDRYERRERYERHERDGRSRGYRDDDYGRRRPYEYERERRHEREHRERDGPRRARDEDEGERAARAAALEAEEIARDELTVLVQRIHPRADDFELFEFFSQAGEVNDIRIIKDQRSGRSKGVAYVEFADAESLTRAMALSGIAFMGQPLLVQPSLAERNRAAQQSKNASAAAKLLTNGGGAGPGITPQSVPPGVPSATCVFVQGLPAALEEADLRAVLLAFGELAKLELKRATAAGAPAADDAPAGSPSAPASLQCVVEYSRAEDASTAVAGLDGYVLGAHTLRANHLMLHPPRGALPPPPPAPPGMLPAAALMPAAAAGASPFPPAPGPLPPGAVPPYPPSEQLGIVHMFDPAGADALDEPDFFPDLIDDVRDECAKFGPVTDCFADRAPPGTVYVRFADVESCVRASVSLTGRWYSGRQLGTHYLAPGALDAARLKPTAVLPPPPDA